MGVGGMIGGGIFSVLGLAIAQAGHAAPLAFALGGLVALITGMAYGRLGLRYQSDGGSFTYLEKAFRHPNIAGIGGWLLLAGYIGTLSLYAYTFGAYGAAMLNPGGQANPAMHHLLESLILLTFLGINLYGVKASGTTELLIVTVKVLILLLFAIIGLFFVKADHLLPVFNQGQLGVLMGAALIFVAYEGFELIPNAVNEMEDPGRNLVRGIFWSIGITIVVYVLVSLVAVGNLTPDEIHRYGEYALAVAAKPFLGQAGFLLIGLAALFSTASAINATLFGTARLGKIMAEERELPAAFAFVRRSKDIPLVQPHRHHRDCPRLRQSWRSDRDCRLLQFHLSADLPGHQPLGLAPAQGDRPRAGLALDRHAVSPRGPADPARVSLADPALRPVLDRRRLRHGGAGRTAVQPPPARHAARGDHPMTAGPRVLGLGGIVIGAKVPILLPSRSDPPQARRIAAALAILIHSTRETDA